MYVSHCPSRAGPEAANVAWLQRSEIRGDGATGFPVFRCAAYGLPPIPGTGMLRARALPATATLPALLARPVRHDPTWRSRAWPAPTPERCVLFSHSAAGTRRG